MESGGFAYAAALGSSAVSPLEDFHPTSSGTILPPISRPFPSTTRLPPPAFECGGGGLGSASSPHDERAIADVTTLYLSPLNEFNRRSLPTRMSSINECHNDQLWMRGKEVKRAPFVFVRLNADSEELRRFRLDEAAMGVEAMALPDQLHSSAKAQTNGGRGGGYKLSILTPGLRHLHKAILIPPPRGVPTEQGTALAEGHPELLLDERKC
ncbi:hypothetical protein NMY22_g16644 [Coprinellus aureogranulatus]|nr:hypothetical protein NMY22_g16644 [Coprinellus aureogranulatus]